MDQGRLEHRVKYVQEPAVAELVVLNHAVGGPPEVRDHRTAGGDQRVQRRTHRPALPGAGPSGSGSASGAIRPVMVSNLTLPTVWSASVTSRWVTPSASICDSA